MKELALPSDFNLREIKSTQITPEELEEMRGLSGSYESLFSKRSRQYGILDLKNKDLKENDYRDLILKEYTFFKRPVTIFEGEIYIGNAPKEVARLKLALTS